MYEAKTKPTTASVTSFLAGVGNDERRRDCKALVSLMKRVTGRSPKMRGSSIVGFDRYHYKYPSGHEGDCCVVGFSPRKDSLSIYLLPGFEDAAVKRLLGRLGRHKAGKACLYIKRLADVQLPVLEELVARSVAETRRRYPAQAR